ncbi:PepSY-associated TM helix domain-containing protein [Alishewanella longhuensis]
MASWLQQQGVKAVSWQPRFEDDEQTLELSFKRPAGYAVALVDFSSAEIELEQQFSGYLALANDLHKGRDAGLLWKWLIDITAIACLLFAITGFYLLFKNALEKVSWQRVSRDRRHDGDIGLPDIAALNTYVGRITLKRISISLVSAALFAFSPLQATEAEITLQIPEIETAQYYRPYVAVWVENAEQQSVKLIALWRKEPDWLKDIRRFWRKIGRSEPELVDAMTGATRTPGKHRLTWDGKDDQGNALAAGSYTLYVEASREQGGRSLQKIDFKLDGTPYQLTAAAAEELGELLFIIK